MRACYTIAPHLIVLDDLPKALVRGHPAQIPAVLALVLAHNATGSSERVSLGEVPKALGHNRESLAEPPNAQRIPLGVTSAIGQAGAIHW